METMSDWLITVSNTLSLLGLAGLLGAIAIEVWEVARHEQAAPGAGALRYTAVDRASRGLFIAGWILFGAGLAAQASLFLD